MGIGDNIGHFLPMDKATYNRSHTGIARICMDMDMDYELPEKIFLQSDNLEMPSYWQPIKYHKFLILLLLPKSWSFSLVLQEEKVKGRFYYKKGDKFNEESRQ